jgi:outer membrane protein
MKTRRFRSSTASLEGDPSMQRAILASVVLLLVCLLTTGPARSEPIRVSTEQPDLAARPALQIEGGELLLSLPEAISIALERNLSLVIERYSTEAAELAITQNVGIYDVFAEFDLATLEEISPAATNLDGAEIQQYAQDNADLRVSQLVPTGGTVRLDWLNRRQDTNSTFATLNPNYRVDMDLHFVQPLLRNLGRLATDRNIRIARTNQAISLENFELQVTAVILMVERAYWDLAEAIAQLEVAEQSLDLAKQLQDQNKIRVEVGTLAPLELVQSEAGVAQREVDIIRARAAVGDRGDVLRQLLNIKRNDDLWQIPVKPTSDPFLDPFEVDMDEAIATALANRPELRRKELDLRNRELDVRYFKNQKKPRLDFVGTYGYNGLGGDVIIREGIGGDPIEILPGGYSDAIDQIKGLDFEGWRTALAFAYPIQNRTAKAQSAIAEVNYEQGQAEYEDLELSVVTEVRRVARALGAAAESVESADVNRRLQQKNYEAEQKRYDNGMSTSFQVLRIQDDLTLARSQYVSAVAAYRRALALYYQSLGTLIPVSNVDIVETTTDQEADATN